VTVEELANRLDDLVAAQERRAAAAEREAVALEQLADTIEQTSAELLRHLRWMRCGR